MGLEPSIKVAKNPHKGNFSELVSLKVHLSVQITVSSRILLRLSLCNLLNICTNLLIYLI